MSQQINTCVSGSWRYTPAQLQDDLSREVKAALGDGQMIITGGALGVDYLTTEICLQALRQIEVHLPTSFENYADHYHKSARQGVITVEQAEQLVKQLHILQQLGCLHEGAASRVDKRSYYERNSVLLRSAHRLLAFQVNSSAGTQDTIDKARQQGLEVVHYSYQVGGSSSST